MSSFGTTIIVALSLAIVPSAGAAELTIVSSTAMKELLEAVLPVFEHATGHRVQATWVPARELPDKVKDGVRADLIVATPEMIEDLVGAGRIQAGSSVEFMRSAVGVAVRAGAPKPNLRTIDDFKRTLLSARSIGVSRGPSGVYFLSLIDRLRIAEAVKPKIVFTESGQRVGVLVASGRAEIGVQQITELLATSGIDFVAPLPKEVQTVIVYATARPVDVKEPIAADQLVMFLSSAVVAPVAKRMGLEPK